MKTIAIAGTFDTKGREFLYLKEIIERQGVSTFTIHAGVFAPLFEPDISNARVARAAGADIEALAAGKDRALATEVLSQGMAKLVPELFAQGKFDGIISLGGSGGTSLVAPAMRALPIGVPKVMVSTVASGNTSQYVGTSDMVMMPSVVDVSGLNSISKKIFANAAAAVAAMVRDGGQNAAAGAAGAADTAAASAADTAAGAADTGNAADKPLIAATMFGVTTPCLDYAREYLEARGYEVLIFHATGTGGQTMEALIEAGFIQGVLDITTTEWCDELVGGVLAAGPHRLEAAARMGIPQVVSAGALDMVNFGPADTVPEQFKDRNLYRHNPTVTLMRTTVSENKLVGRVIAEKLNQATGPAVMMLPLKGLSMIDEPGQPFYGPAEDEALFQVLRAELNRDRVELIELPLHINERAFAEAAAQKLLDIMTMMTSAKADREG